MKEEKLINLRIRLREETYHFLEEIIQKLGSHVDLENIKEEDLQRVIAWLKVLDDKDFPCGKVGLLEKLKEIQKKEEE